MTGGGSRGVEISRKKRNLNLFAFDTHDKSNFFLSIVIEQERKRNFHFESQNFRLLWKYQAYSLNLRLFFLKNFPSNVTRVKKKIAASKFSSILNLTSNLLHLFSCSQCSQCLVHSSNQRSFHLLFLSHSLSMSLFISFMIICKYKSSNIEEWKWKDGK